MEFWVGRLYPPLTGTIPAGIRPTFPESAVEFEVQGCSCPVLPNPPFGETVQGKVCWVDPLPVLPETPHRQNIQLD